MGAEVEEGLTFNDRMESIKKNFMTLGTAICSYIQMTTIQ